MAMKLVSRKVTFGLAAVAVAAFVGVSGQLGLAQASEDDEAAEEAAADDEAAADEAEAEGAGEEDAALAQLMTEGGSVYSSNCQACHGNEGQGGAGPALAGSPILTSIGTISRQVIDGGDRMPSFSQLSDRQIAAVATFIRNSWGNEFGIVTEEDIASWR
ncbi:MAG: cytochrome c [Bauldia sp.]|nr:cytochrome c [Bauldia sp.]